MDKAKAIEAKSAPFLKKGGEASPSLPLKEGYKTPKQMADELWNLMKPQAEE